MRNFKIKFQVSVCGLCHGMGVLETGTGDTRECIKCNGKGVI